MDVYKGCICQHGVWGYLRGEICQRGVWGYLRGEICQRGVWMYSRGGICQHGVWMYLRGGFVNGADPQGAHGVVGVEPQTPQAVLVRAGGDRQIDR